MYKYLCLFALLFCFACQPETDGGEDAVEDNTLSEEGDFVWQTESFADKKIIRYQIPGFEELSLQQKKLVYYLTQAGLAGRDITFDQNYRHNLEIRHALDKVMNDFMGPRDSDDWKALEEYTKNVWFSSGIHHHYSNDKFIPGFSKEYLTGLMTELGASMSEEALSAMFDPNIDAKKVAQSGDDLVQASAVNFYAPNVTQKEVEAFYEKQKEGAGDQPISYGLNSRVAKDAQGNLVEQVYKADGLYGEAITEIVKWLEKAVEVAENEPQKKALKLLIEYYNTGDLKTWDAYNIAWVEATEGDIDYINSFIEVYQDPMGMKGSYESIIQINDFDASKRMGVVSANAAWFEQNSPVAEEHKKKEVSGITYKVVTVAGESGDASPSTPIGVNLPNANWIRKEHGSKSVSLGNIIAAYANADGPGLLKEFAHDEEEVARTEKYGQVSGKMHTALHEVLGHASGQLEAGVEITDLKNYASPLEEARADLFGLYYITDPKLMELGLFESEDQGKAQYDAYLRNGAMLQLRRIEPGKNIAQAHMRNRQMVSTWVIEKGTANGSIEMAKKEGKTYIDIKDYAQVRELFGQLLKEVQRIKSQGDYEAGKNLIESYGVQVDKAIHEEVLARSEALNIAPYGGFINPVLSPLTDENGEITDIKVEYPDDFAKQMLDYAKEYSFLPIATRD